MDPSDAPRLLTADEINEVIIHLTYNGTKPLLISPCKEISEYNGQQLVKYIQEDLSTIELCPSMFQEFKNEYRNAFQKVFVDPGEFVGITTSNVLGRGFTQTALNSKNATGSGKAYASGFEAVRKYLKLSPAASTEDDIATIFFKEKMNFDSIMTTKKAEFSSITLKDLTESVLIENARDLLTPSQPWWYSRFTSLIKTGFDEGSVIARFTLRKDLLFSMRISMRKVADVLENDGKLRCLYSPLSEATIDIYPITEKIRELQVKGKNKLPSNLDSHHLQISYLTQGLIPKTDILGITGILKIKNIFHKSIALLTIVRSESYDPEFDFYFVTIDLNRAYSLGIRMEELIDLYVYCGMEVNPALLEDGTASPSDFYVRSEVSGSPTEQVKARIEAASKRMESVASNGPVGSDALSSMEKDRQDLEMANISVAETIGSNLHILLSRDDVDETRTFDNNIQTAFNIFGIEAARYLLVDRMMNLINSSGQEIDPHNISLLVDFITNKGILSAINDSGLESHEYGPLTEAAYSKADITFSRAGAFGKNDPLNTTTSRIYPGKLIWGGTSTVQLVTPSGRSVDDLMDELKKGAPLDTATFNRNIRNRYYFREGDPGISPESVLVEQGPPEDETISSNPYIPSEIPLPEVGAEMANPLSLGTITAMGAPMPTNINSVLQQTYNDIPCEAEFISTD